MSTRGMSFTKVALMVACCLALTLTGALAAEGGKRMLLGGGSGGYDHLLGKWQGTCVQKYVHGYGCTEDIITYPYYVEYKYDKWSHKYFSQYRQDAVHISTDHHYNPSREYDVHAYSGKGEVSFYKVGSSSYCVNFWDDHDHESKRTYRIKYKQEGDLKFIVEEGEYYAHDEHHGVWNKCFNKSYKSLFCGHDSYSYRCYLVKTSYDYKW